MCEHTWGVSVGAREGLQTSLHILLLRVSAPYTPPLSPGSLLNSTPRSDPTRGAPSSGLCRLPGRLGTGAGVPSLELRAAPAGWGRPAFLRPASPPRVNRCLGILDVLSAPLRNNPLPPSWHWRWHGALPLPSP